MKASDKFHALKQDIIGIDEYRESMIRMKLSRSWPRSLEPEIVTITVFLRSSWTPSWFSYWSGPLLSQASQPQHGLGMPDYY